MGKKVNAIIARLEGARRFNTYANCHMDVNIEESKNGNWVSFYDIQQLITEIKDGDIKPTKSIIDDKSPITSKLSVSEAFQLAINNLEKEIAIINSITEHSKSL